MTYTAASRNSHNRMRTNRFQQHGTKRGRSGDSPDLSVRKRPRQSVDIASLSPAQLAIVAQAAAILQVQIPELPGTLGSQSRGLQTNNTSQAIPALQLPIMDSMESRSQASKETRPNSKMRSGINTSQQDDSRRHDICDISEFNFGLIPRQVADCFASLITPNSALTPPESQGKFMYLVEQLSFVDILKDDEGSYYTGMTMTSSPLLVNSNSNSRFSSSSLNHDLQRPEGITGYNLLESNSSLVAVIVYWH